MEVIYKHSDINETAGKFLKATAGFKTFAFSGDLGAGKTTFIHALCSQLKVRERATSPTYSIIQEYSTHDGKTIYHMDWYRLRDEDEAIQAGVEDCLQSGQICLIEWPEKAEGLLSEKTIYTRFDMIDQDTRQITVTIPQ